MPHKGKMPYKAKKTGPHKKKGYAGGGYAKSGYKKGGRAMKRGYAKKSKKG